MPTLPTEAETAGGIALRFAATREERLLAGPAATVLAVPGTEVTIHWLALEGDLTPAQAAAAARLMLADASAEPLGEMHVAAGRPENGLTPVALVPAARMAEWVADDPDVILPETLLLLPPAEGFVRHGLDHRGVAAAFSVEPDLAALLTGDAPVVEIGEADFAAGLSAALAEPVINLRQGAFARRRQWRIDPGATRRIAIFAALLAIVSLVLQFATILRYSFDADRMEQEAARLAPGPSRGAANFDRLAPALFAAVQSTPNVELTRFDYRADGSLGATVTVDTPATLAAFRARIEGGGVTTQGGTITNVGGRPTAELVLRPA